MSSIFNTFKQSTFSSKLLKSSLSRILNQMKTDNLRISFNIWTKVNWNAEEHNQKIDRENRYSNSKNKSEHQETLENELLKITGGSNNLHCKLQSQSYKILANCV